MSDARREGARVRREAADWFTRLSRRSVTTQALREFREWRQAPQNRAEYEKIERVWSASGSLADDPDVLALRQQTLAQTGRRSPVSAAWLRGLAVASLAAVALVIAVVAWPRPATYASGVGEQRIVRLADGTVMRLNTDSRAAIRITKTARLVSLDRGEAFFDVAHDARRPFRVRADGAEVEALGTRFEVERDAAGVNVVLVQGSVIVRTDAGQAARLQPNQQVRVERAKLTLPAAADTRRLTSWTEGRLIFESTPLASAIAEVNRYSTRRVELAADDLKDAPVNGVFETGDTRAFAAAAASVFDLELTETPDNRLVLRRRDAS